MLSGLNRLGQESCRSTLIQPTLNWMSIFHKSTALCSQEEPMRPSLTPSMRWDSPMSVWWLKNCSIRRSKPIRKEIISQLLACIKGCNCCLLSWAVMELGNKKCFRIFQPTTTLQTFCLWETPPISNCLRIKTRRYWISCRKTHRFIIFQTGR